MALFHLERYEEAAALLIAAIERNPAFDRTQLLLASTYGQLGKLEKAEWILQEVALLSADLSLNDEETNSILSREQDRERYIEGLRLAGLENQDI
jgi:adenylate cyclase